MEVMRGVVYPLVRLSRATTAGVLVHQSLASTELALLAVVACDFASIVADARPFLRTWAQFWLAGLFLPWFYESYWEQFASHPNFRLYYFELSVFAMLALVVVFRG